MTDTALQEPWSTPERQRVAVQFGVWAFLTTETLFFGGLFLVYAVARYRHPAGFVAGARETELLLGAVNTAILLTSSLTMAVAERATREALIPLARAMFAATGLLGAAFLAVKGFEYHSDITKHLLPGAAFPRHQTGAAQFWAFYWTATGIHACHLAIGLGVVGRMLLIPHAELAARGTAAEGSALYWHFVDLVWVLLFALLYLVGR